MRNYWKNHLWTSTRSSAFLNNVKMVIRKRYIELLSYMNISPVLKKSWTWLNVSYVAIHFPPSESKPLLCPNWVFAISLTGFLSANVLNVVTLNGMVLRESEDIKKRWQEYTEELYKKDLHDPDNHDGVITQLEPDILELKSSGP